MIVATRRQQRLRARSDAGRSGEYSSPACYLHEFETQAATAPGIEIKRIYEPAQRAAAPVVPSQHHLLERVPAPLPRRAARAGGAAAGAASARHATARHTAV